MKFNAEEHTEIQRRINYGRTKWPSQKNITKLYEMACRDLGVESKIISMPTSNHLSIPEESVKESIQSKLSALCPKCGKKSFTLYPLCRSCKDAEGGKYKVIFRCYECKFEGKSMEPLVVWLERLGIEFGTQSRKSLGIKTITDGGLK